MRLQTCRTRVGIHLRGILHIEYYTLRIKLCQHKWGNCIIVPNTAQKNTIMTVFVQKYTNITPNVQSILDTFYAYSTERNKMTFSQPEKLTASFPTDSYRKAQNAHATTPAPRAPCFASFFSFQGIHRQTSSAKSTQIPKFSRAFVVLKCSCATIICGDLITFEISPTI